MELGIIGLGRMGANMARRLRRGSSALVAYNRSYKVAQDLAKETGLEAAESIERLVSQLPTPRVVRLMLPAGDITQQHVDTLQSLLEGGDIVVACTSPIPVKAAGPQTRRWSRGSPRR